jgi:serine/threonine protein phosphatase 1
MLDVLRTLFGRKRPDAATIAARARLAAAEWPAVVYAIGDVHGCLDELLLLERMIAEDAADVGDGERWLVTLGDYVDRGPHAAQVISHLMSVPPEGFRRIVLAGNHEQLLLDFLADPIVNAQWLDFGGLETAQSYGMRNLPDSGSARGARAIARDLASLIPVSHLDFLRGLPISLALPGQYFVHAGVRPGVPIDQQTEEDLLWIRAPFLEQGSDVQVVVVHGHTPTNEPEITPWRIGIDTGAFASGRLTAVRLQAHRAPTFLATGPQSTSRLRPRPEQRPSCRRPR